MGVRSKGASELVVSKIEERDQLEGRRTQEVRGRHGLVVVLSVLDMIPAHHLDLTEIIRLLVLSGADREKQESEPNSAGWLQLARGDSR